MVGCMVGFIPPSAVAWFRGIVMAHIEFTANGVLMVAFGFLVRELYLSPVALKVWFATLQIGTWANGAAGVAAAFIGASSKLMPTINEKFPPPHGTDNPIVSGSLQLCGVTIMAGVAAHPLRPIALQDFGLRLERLNRALQQTLQSRWWSQANNRPPQ